MFAFINTSKMPPYLNEFYFDRWLDSFNVSLSKIGLSKFVFSNLNIEFSGEEEKYPFGTLTIKELKEFIRSTWGINEEIEKILRQIKNLEDYRNLIQELISIILRMREEDETISNPEILFEYLNELEFDIPVLGRYRDNDKLIILFTKNIEKAADNHNPKNTPVREFEKVFIHELFHAYHHIVSCDNSSDELSVRRDYTSKVVKESLASAFEWFYCIENKINGETDLQKSWYEHSTLCYPYSGAKELLSIIGGTELRYSLKVKKFCEIFEESLSDMDGALRALLDSYDFYRIKNAAEVYEKKVIKPKPVFTTTKPNVFKINSSKSFCTESKNGYIFAPADNRHKEITNVRKGDILLQIFGGKLHAISLVTKGCYYTTAAHGQTKAGYYADATYMILDDPIDILQFKNESSYPIRRNEPYIRNFNCPDFIQLVLKALKKKFPQNDFCITLISMLIS